MQRPDAPERFWTKTLAFGGAVEALAPGVHDDETREHEEEIDEKLHVLPARRRTQRMRDRGVIEGDRRGDASAIRPVLQNAVRMTASGNRCPI